MLREAMAGISAKRSRSTTMVLPHHLQLKLESARRLLSRESTCLLNAVVTGDALYTNKEDVRLVFMKSCGDVLLSVKGNESKLERKTLRASRRRPLFALGEAEDRNGQVIERRIKRAPIEPMKSSFALEVHVLADAQIVGLLRTALLAPVRKAGHHSLPQGTKDFAVHKWDPWDPTRVMLHQIVL
jgi:hypothetical protein